MNIGNPLDDFVGSDSLLDLGFTYNGDDLDENYIQTFGGYGNGPPALGTTLLETPDGLGMTNYIAYESPAGPKGRPILPEHYYQYMQSRFADNTPLVNNGQDGYSSTAAGPVTDFMYSGNAGFCGTPTSGWSERTAGSVPGQRISLQSSGPFDLLPGESVDFVFATVYARGGVNLFSVCKLKTLTTKLRAWYDTLQVSCIVPVGIEDPEFSQGIGSITIAPNPTDGRVLVSLEGGYLPSELTVISTLGQVIRTFPISRNQPNKEIYLSS
jgi:hypothetical protein